MPLYSEEIQDIIGKIPGKILKIGLSVIFGIILFVITGSYFFRYPEIISCPLVLTTINPPVELYARTTGMISRLEVREHDTVEAGQVIAVIKNTADYEDALMLEGLLERLEKVTIWDSVVVTEELPPRLVLGELQSGYLQMCRLWNEFQRYLRQGYLPLKIGIQKKQVWQEEINYQELCSRQELQQKDFELTKRQFTRDSVFFRRFQEAVSQVDFEKQMQAFLQKKSAYLSFCTSVREAANSILKRQEELVDLEIRYEKELAAYRQQLDEMYRLLYESFRQWKEKYIVSSEVAGTVTLTGYWSANQTISSGERLATVVPLVPSSIIGRAIVDMNGIGKVQEGQAVHIKLTGYPFMEFGMIRGVVRHVSLVPEKAKGYIAEIELEKGMVTSYREPLKFIQEIEGTAEIITRDSRLLMKLLDPLRAKITD